MKIKLSFIQHTDHLKIVFNIRQYKMQTVECIVKHAESLSKSTTLENDTWKTDWWSMFLSKLDQNHAALPKFIV